jgi:hypothetical protein
MNIVFMKVPEEAVKIEGMAFDRAGCIVHDCKMLTVFSSQDIEFTHGGNASECL